MMYLPKKDSVFIYSLSEALKIIGNLDKKVKRIRESDFEAVAIIVVWNKDDDNEVYMMPFDTEEEARQYRIEDTKKFSRWVYSKDFIRVAEKVLKEERERIL